MNPLLSSRLDLLEAGIAKSEHFLVRLRQLIEDLRFDGLATAEAEAMCRKFEAATQALLVKRDALRLESKETY